MWSKLLSYVGCLALRYDDTDNDWDVGAEGAVTYLHIYPWWPKLALNLCHPPPDSERQQQVLTK
jgi:hypothetical protein